VVAPRRNPRRKKGLVFDAFKGLRVKVALVRDPDFDPKLLFQITSPAQAVGFLRSAADDITEGMWVLILNSKHRVLGVYEAARGGTSSVEVRPSDLLRAVLVLGAERFILVHNHPSGEAEPSSDDDALTHRVAKAAKLLGMTLLDHVVVGYNDFFAYSERRPGALEA